jgi:hypothetical protein
MQKKAKKVITNILSHLGAFLLGMLMTCLIGYIFRVQIVALFIYLIFKG